MKNSHARVTVLMGLFLLPLSGVAEDMPSMALLEFLAEDDVDESLLDRSEALQLEVNDKNLMDADEAIAADFGEER
jgi:hypothetical protein